MATAKKSEEMIEEAKVVGKTIRELAESVKEDNIASPDDFKEKFDGIKESSANLMKKVNGKIESLKKEAAEIESQIDDLNEASQPIRNFVDKGGDQLEKYFFHQVKEKSTPKTVSEILEIEPEIHSSIKLAQVCKSIKDFFTEFFEEFKRTESPQDED